MFVHAGFFYPAHYRRSPNRPMTLCGTRTDT
jgi:hypothetical protein